jgi:hypothetical protein
MAGFADRRSSKIARAKGRLRLTSRRSQRLQ